LPDKPDKDSGEHQEDGAYARGVAVEIHNGNHQKRHTSQSVTYGLFAHRLLKRVLGPICEEPLAARLAAHIAVVATYLTRELKDPVRSRTSARGSVSGLWQRSRAVAPEVTRSKRPGRRG
jgi:hypothetical protein